MNYLSYKKYLIFLKIEKPFNINSYSFAIFHGIMGRLLYNLDLQATKDKHTNCLGKECAYCSLFKNQLPSNHEAYGMYTNPPQGFVLKPPFPMQKEYKKGDSIELELTLIGVQIKYINSLELAFSKIGDLNLKRFTGNFSYLGMKLLKEQSPTTRIGKNITTSSDGKKSFTLKTPLRLISKSKYIHKPNFSQLINSLLNRVTLLELIYCGRPFDKELLSMKNSIIIEAEKKLYNRIGSRVDIEIGKRINTSGVVGNYIVSDSNIDDYMLLLECAADIHIGQYASYGMGQLLHI